MPPTISLYSQRQGYCLYMYMKQGQHVKYIVRVICVSVHVRVCWELFSEGVGVRRIVN